MIAGDAKSICIEILGKQQKFTCSPEQAVDLYQAASELATMCADIKIKSNGGSSERALLTASINLSYSLLMANNKIEQYQREQNALISTLKDAL